MHAGSSEKGERHSDLDECRTQNAESGMKN
jgi:hypothetical protein